MANNEKLLVRLGDDGELVQGNEEQSLEKPATSLVRGIAIAIGAFILGGLAGGLLFAVSWSQRISSVFFGVVVAGITVPSHVTSRKAQLGSIFLLALWLVQDFVLAVFWGDNRLLCGFVFLCLPSIVGLNAIVAVAHDHPRSLRALGTIILLGMLAYLLPYALATPVSHSTVSFCFSLSISSSSCPPTYHYNEYLLGSTGASTISMALLLIVAFVGNQYLNRVIPKVGSKKM